MGREILKNLLLKSRFSNISQSQIITKQNEVMFFSLKDKNIFYLVCEFFKKYYFILKNFCIKKTGCSLVWLKVPALEAEDRRFKSFHPEKYLKIASQTLSSSNARTSAFHVENIGWIPIGSIFFLKEGGK